MRSVAFLFPGQGSQKVGMGQALAQAYPEAAAAFAEADAALGESLRAAPGFVLHTAHPTEEGWRVFEIWESAEEANRWFAQAVAPNLPPGVFPKRKVESLHSLVRR